MEIILDKIGRKFNYEWIFRNIDFKFSSGNAYAILGSNGSGKSTLLQIISGHLHPSAGKIEYFEDNKAIPVDEIFKYLSYSGPYLEIIEEFTLQEMVDFHLRFKKTVRDIRATELIEATTLWKNRNKPIKYFSSGMKQRVKLALAVLSDNPLVLLDEPVSNLDTGGIKWYRKLVDDNREGRIYIICSNSIAAEYDFCNESIQIDEHKT